MPAVVRVTGLMVISLSGLKIPLTPSFSHQTLAGGLLSAIHLMVTESFSSSKLLNEVDSVTTYGGSAKRKKTETVDDACSCQKKCCIIEYHTQKLLLVLVYIKIDAYLGIFANTTARK